ncbi:ATP-binding protein [Actinorugispora endophytica]|uniref:Anti-sigma regulatory factor (Ser/Thr protein kinase) n=1 Tax=Actinorugispora endophytica TaxID=1605990 RepID=A0A4V3D901_9ACTN|nr:ATP-binding protein [Actinorugispora endophytica]TDQ53810.1 anti-sigma regulatory factor (Ser/Thr protein kinase) [Actinorugispora endophytica]
MGTTDSQGLRTFGAAGPYGLPAVDASELVGSATDHTVWSCIGNLTAVRSIRARVREFLTRQSYPGAVQEDAELAVSELATNALLHSRSGQVGGVMTLFIRIDADRVRIAVADQGEKDPDEEGVVGREDGGEYGRGKLIVEDCADRSGEYWTEATHVTWFEIDVPRSA